MLIKGGDQLMNKFLKKFVKTVVKVNQNPNNPNNYYISLEDKILWMKKNLRVPALFMLDGKRIINAFKAEDIANEYVAKVAAQSKASK